MRDNDRLRGNDKFRSELVVHTIESPEQPAIPGTLEENCDQRHSNSQENEAKLQAILDTTVDGIVTIDEQGTVQSFNRAAESIFGYFASEVIGRNVKMLMPSPFRENHDTYIENYLHTGNRKIIGKGREVMGRRKDGTEFPLYLAVSEVWVGRKRIFTGILRDITERKKTEEELRRAKEELERRVLERTAQLEWLTEQLQQEIQVRKQTEEELKLYTVQLERSNRDLQDFAFVASHDLQEPLRKMQAFADRIQARYAGCFDDQGRDYLERVEKAAQRMRDLIQALLRYSQIATKAEPFQIVDLNRVAWDAVDDLDVLVAQTRASIQIENLPSIEADVNQMRQLFQNLIANSLKFRREQAPEVKIYARRLDEGSNSPVLATAFGEAYEIHVEDNGIGFDEKYLDRIFIPFERLHGNRSPYEGTGMGLAICRKIVERHGGIITAKSSPGRGANFIVTLPAKPPDPVESCRPCAIAENFSH